MAAVTFPEAGAQFPDIANFSTDVANQVRELTVPPGATVISIEPLVNDGKLSVVQTLDDGDAIAGAVKTLHKDESYDVDLAQGEYADGTGDTRVTKLLITSATHPTSFEAIAMGGNQPKRVF